MLSLDFLISLSACLKNCLFSSSLTPVLELEEELLEPSLKNFFKENLDKAFLVLSLPLVEREEATEEEGGFGGAEMELEICGLEGGGDVGLKKPGGEIEELVNGR